VIWLVWFVLCVVSFGVLEGLAIRSGRFATLSRTVWNMQRAFPLTSVLLALVLGGLLVHFFWHWCPPGSMSQG